MDFDYWSATLGHLPCKARMCRKFVSSSSCSGSLCSVWVAIGSTSWLISYRCQGKSSSIATMYLWRYYTSYSQCSVLVKRKFVCAVQLVHQHLCSARNLTFAFLRWCQTLPTKSGEWNILWEERKMETSREEYFAWSKHEITSGHVIWDWC